MKIPAFKSIINASVPLCAIETADPAQTQLECIKALKKSEEQVICSWDILRGLYGISEPGKEFEALISPNGALDTGNPAECLGKLMSYAGKIGSKGKLIVFFSNAHRFISNEAVAQGIWNLRDEFKARGYCLVLVAPSLTLPSELKHDVVILSEPLPGTDELDSILSQIEKDAELPVLNGDARPVVIDTMRGLSAFSAEQALAMSVAGKRIDVEALWDRKRRMIEQTPGLAVWKGGETFENLGGLENLKKFLTSVLTSGKTPVRAIGFIDEIEKGLAGSGGDTSGTSQDQLQVFLKAMQDLDIPGIILVGPPGTGKSAISKAAGAVAGCPVVAIDTGAMKASLVGESEQRIRAAMDVFKAVSQGKGLFIATCNKIASLPPELRRRFTLGTFFVDLPSEEERGKIWQVWGSRYSIAPQALPKSEGWTGAEIRACCDVAFRTGLTLEEASKFVVPVIKSAPDQVEALRKLASGRFISANHPGLYEVPETKTAPATGRKFGE